ncbi:N-alpha-acetyltransferase 35, NatC auxiliary subunit homolog isoform X2 [Drosophila teissieri]|uniref:N-alpha-acetyltransferase 35, NatC auxiliary subunit homolog isoform X2 n=1 Tax=Drosophila teissieri TaxID=7243 RepID=UPI001CBA14DE|nr:N-alpha-acetyltransferase 35, NatC auxiliary subunit homolog isoform X2 [Drosophila teissieri]
MYPSTLPAEADPSTMNGSVAEPPDFQAVTAAAAAAARALSLEQDEWSVSECGFLDPEVQRTMRSGSAAEDITQYPIHGWVDVTKEFHDACAELQPGELAQDMLFGLFEAMSAIEIMDPKMDVGMGFDKQDLPPPSFEAAIATGAIKLDDLTPSELIGIYDALFSCLVSWLEGNSMDQVLFTCLYLHAPAQIKDKALRVFCTAVRNLIVVIKNIIAVAAVNEEEDFQLYGNSALLAAEKAQPASVYSSLKDVEDELIRKCKKLTSTEDWMAVVHRLRFMRHLFQVIYHVEQMASNDTVDDKVDIYKILLVASEMLPGIRNTLDRGTQPEKGSDAPNPMGFSPRIHDRSQPPAFPRSIKIRDRPASYQFLEEMISRFKYACKVTKYKDYYSALNFFIEYSKKSGQCILSRSVLQSLFSANMRMAHGKLPMKQFLRHSVQIFNSPPVLNAKHPVAADPKVQQHLENFFRYCINMNTFTQFIRICGFNRARQRDKLARLIENFDTIQVDAARLDSMMNQLANERAMEGNEPMATALKHSTHFSTWVLYNCFRAMLIFLMSGFELELYAVHEFLYIYWYPYEFLIGFLVSALTRTENILLAQEEYAEHQSKIQSGGGGAAKNRKAAKPKKNKKTQRPYRAEIVFYHALLSLCGGMYKAMGALTKDGRVRLPLSKFDNEEIRYNRRFLPFATLTSPPPVSYAEFKNIREHMMRPSVEDLYTYAAKHFDQARNVLESIQNPDQEMLDLLQIARTNFVVMNVLARGHQKEVKRQPEFDFSKHSYFPIIKLK